jgi:hypothetical protein
MSALAAVPRPNGKLYRPRKLSAHAVTDYHGDDLDGVVVFGSHEWTEAVQKLADDYVAWQVDRGYAAAAPRRVWWRDGYDMGVRRWIDDPVRGRAGMVFEIVERARGREATE